MAKKILLVDDDLYIRDVYEEILKSEGFEVETAINGQDGLTKLVQGGYAVILLDIMMPTLDGVAVLEEIQKNPPQQKNGPIIVLSNLELDSVIKAAKEKGAASYLIKAEVTPNELIAAVKAIIGEQTI